MTNFLEIAQEASRGLGAKYLVMENVMEMCAMFKMVNFFIYKLAAILFFCLWHRWW
jgi:hypothetical protein